MAGAKSFRELKVYIAPREAAKLLFSASEVLSRMIDPADDFCNHGPATDHRTIDRVEEEPPFTDH